MRWQGLSEPSSDKAGADLHVSRFCRVEDMSDHPIVEQHPWVEIEGMAQSEEGLQGDCLFALKAVEDATLGESGAFR